MTYAAAVADTGDRARKAFVELVLDEATKSGSITGAFMDESQAFSLAVSTTDGQKHTLYLGNIFAELVDVTGEERRARVARLLRECTAEKPAPNDWEDARYNLVSVVRSCQFGERLRHTLVSRPFLPFLREFVVIDRQDSMSYVTQGNLEAWDVPEGKVFESGRAVLRASTDLAAHIAPYDPSSPYPIWHYAWEDSYESSRLLLPEVLEWFRDRVHGNPIAAIPTRSLFVVTGDGDEDAVRRIATLADDEYTASPRRVSPAIYTLANRTVVPYETPASHPCRDQVHLGHLKLAGREYQDQQTDIVATFERTGTDIFVAKCAVVTFNDGRRPISYCVWTEDVDSLLPAAEYVAVGGQKDGTTWSYWVPWAKVLDIARDCLEPADGFVPPRWRTRAWPDEKVLARLREAAVKL